MLSATPLLEAFGNAKTVRNNNSSRFGRWIEVHFDASGAIASARIEQYLLEKSRVVHQAANERSYHILYMLCEGDAGEQLGLHHPSAYRFLNGSACYTLDGHNESEDYAAVLSAMADLGFDEEQVEEIFQTLAGILLLGNLTFSATSDRKGEPGCAVADAETAARVAELWKVAPAKLEQSCCRRTLDINGETSHVEFRPTEAVESCAAAAKHVYGALFALIVRRINTSLDGPRGRNVGVLDIFGFEIFEHNSFEQVMMIPPPLSQSKHTASPPVPTLSVCHGHFLPPHSSASTLQTRSCSSSSASTHSNRRKRSTSPKTSRTTASRSLTTSPCST